MTFGECYFNHYEKFFGSPLERRVFRDPNFETSIQILAYENVMENCIVFATLGLARLLSTPVELVSPVDDIFDEIPHVLASAGFAVAVRNAEIKAGGYIAGVAPVSHGIARHFGNESALYVCTPYCLPSEFGSFSCNGIEVKCMYALPIHDSEVAYLRNAGPSNLEKLLELSDADLFSMSRPASITKSS